MPAEGATARPCPLCGGASDVAFRAPDFLHGVPGTWTYRRCHGCGAEFQDPAPSAETTASFYPPDYTVWTPPRPKPASAVRRAVLRSRHGYAHLDVPLLLRPWGAILARFLHRDALPFVPGGRLADLGCGNGDFLLRQQALGWRVRGVESSERAASLCREAGLDVAVADVAATGLPGGAFDAVTARHVIEHLPDPRPLLAEARRLLRPGGLLQLRTPNTRALGRARYGALWFANDPPRHLLLYDPDNLARAVQAAGFEILQSSTRATPKILLDSKDRRAGRPGRPSHRSRWKRALVRPWVAWAALLDRGEEIVLLARR